MSTHLIISSALLVGVVRQLQITTVDIINETNICEWINVMMRRCNVVLGLRAEETVMLLVEVF
jgi:hypothetical protein